VVKVTATDPEKRKAAVAWRAYEIETAFYTSIAPALTADIPQCFWAAFDRESGAYAVVLEDLSELTPGDDLIGCTPPDADRALAELARVHGGQWNDPALTELSWLNRYPRGQAGTLRADMTSASERFAAKFSDRVPAEVLTLIEQFAERSDDYDRKGFGGPRTIVHGDFRGDNLMFGPDRVCILDWQTVQLGSALADAAYYIGGSLTTEHRRAHERDLVRAYHARLRAQGLDLAWDWCWNEYRRHALSLLTTTLKLARNVSTLDERGSDMLLALTQRAAYHALDLESMHLLAD
jgi:aminoglycoside phosphotransferase (APT) family kinase protein